MTIIKCDRCGEEVERRDLTQMDLIRYGDPLILEGDKNGYPRNFNGKRGAQLCGKCTKMIIDILEVREWVEKIQEAGTT